MNQIKLSVCIPVFNGEDFIAEAINSVLSQSFTNFELLVIDNCSTDKTVSIVSSFSDARIRIIQNQSNIGLISNWNKAIENAQGKYIKILPADDLIYPNCLQKQCDVLDADIAEEISMVSSRRNIINNKGKVLFNRGFSKTTEVVSGFEAINRNVRSGGNIIGEGGAIMFRKKIIEKTGLFNSPIFYVLDIDLWYKILLHGKLHALPDVLSAFRVSNSSASVKVINQQKDDVFNFTKSIYQQKQYQVSWFSYATGLAKALALTQAKKILYKYVIK